MPAQKPRITPGVNPLHNQDELDDFAMLEDALDTNDPKAYLEAIYTPVNSPMPLGGSGVENQKTRVVMKDPIFDQVCFKQWVDEVHANTYLLKGFNFVKKELVAASWSSPLTGDAGNLSDKVRIYVGPDEGGEPRYNVLMFIPREMYEKHLQSTHAASKLRVETAESELKHAEAVAMKRAR